MGRSAAERPAHAAVADLAVWRERVAQRDAQVGLAVGSTTVTDLEVDAGLVPRGAARPTGHRSLSNCGRAFGALGPTARPAIQRWPLQPDPTEVVAAPKAAKVTVVW